MKKILIVNNNMKIGGVQKSLYNLLWTVAEKFDITLCLFQKTGVYTEKLPPSVKVLEVSGPFRYLGMSQGECCGRDAVKRAFLVALCRVLGREKLLKTFRCHHPELFRTYDCAISYLHNRKKNSFIYDKDNKNLYYNSIKLADKVEDFQLELTNTSGKDILKVFINIDGTAFQTKYVVGS